MLRASARKVAGSRAVGHATPEGRVTLSEEAISECPSTVHMQPTPDRPRGHHQGLGRGIRARSGRGEVLKSALGHKHPGNRAAALAFRLTHFVDQPVSVRLAAHNFAHTRNGCIVVRRVQAIPISAARAPSPRCCASGTSAMLPMLSAEGQRRPLDFSSLSRRGSRSRRRSTLAGIRRVFVFRHGARCNRHLAPESVKVVGETRCPNLTALARQGRRGTRCAATLPVQLRIVEDPSLGHAAIKGHEAPPRAVRLSEHRHGA